MHIKYPGKKVFLLTLNAFLIFLLAFLVGGHLVRAQSSDEQITIEYFDDTEPNNSGTKSVATIDPQLSNYLNGSGDGTNIPATAQYPEFKDQLSTNVTPEIPKPGEEVTITLEVYSFDINTALITWRVDGKQIERGVGIKKFKFNTKQAGQSTTVTVTVEPSDRPSITKTFSFNTGEVDLLWQADVYSPPFYKGKSFYTPESTLTFVAMPRTSSGLINPKDVVFNWRINNNNDSENSGYGRNSYSFEGPIILRPVEVTVETHEARNSKALASADIVVENNNSLAMFYENHPLYGVLFNRALRGSILLNKNEFGLSAYPYFQTIEGKNYGPVYSWGVDAFGVPIPNNQNTITLRKNQGDVGESFVDLEISNPKKILQSVRTGLIIEFDTTKNSFGL